MLVLGVQQSDSVIYTCGVCVCVSILCQILFPYRKLQNIEYSSPCLTGGSRLSVLYVVVCIC